MRLTTKGRFAVTAMMDLAMRQTRGPVTLAAISERQHISLSYLEQLFGKLRRHKLVSSVRGPGGGYNLARTPQVMTVAEIISAQGGFLINTRELQPFTAVVATFSAVPGTSAGAFKATINWGDGTASTGTTG